MNKSLENAFQWFFVLTLIISALISPNINQLTLYFLIDLILIAVLLYVFTTKQALKIQLPDILVFLMLTANLPSWFYSINKYHTGLAIITQTAFFLYYMLAKQLVRKRTILAVAIALPIVFSLISLWQYTIGLRRLEKLIDLTTLPKTMEVNIVNRLREGRVFASFALPNSFAGYLNLLILLLLAGFTVYPGKIRKVIAISLCLALINLVLTRSFGSIVSLSVVVLIIIYQKRELISKYKILNILFLCLLLFGLAEGYRRYGHGATFKPADSINLRKLNYLSALNIFRDNRFLGTGGGTFGDIYLKYQLRGANVIRYSHNLPLQFAAELGIFGLLLFALFWTYYFVRWKDLAGNNNFFFYLTALVFFLHNLIDIDYNIISISLLFWSVMAVVLREDKQEPWLIPHRYVVIMTLILVIPLLVVNNSWFYAEKSFSQARASNKGAEEYLLRAIKYNSLNPDYYAYLGELNLKKYLESGKDEDKYIKQAVANFTRASERARTAPFYYFRLGVALGIAGDRDGTRAAFAKASEYSPRNERYRSYLRKVESLL